MAIVYRPDTTVNVTHEEWALLQQGFRPGVPPHVSPYTEEADSVLVSRSRCPACRQRGRRFRPFHRPGTKDYEGLAVCKCGHVTRW